MKVSLVPGIKFSILLLCLCFLCSGNIIFAVKGPRIKFDEMTWDFGKTKEGKVLSHVFNFYNTGDTSLNIKRVRTSCGCTAALVSAKEIAPGQKGELKVTFRTKGYTGFVKKYIYVETDDKEHVRISLMIAADIEVPPSPKINLDRYSIDLGLILETEEIQTRFKISNSGERELIVSLQHKEAVFFQGDNNITADLKIAPGKETKIRVKLPPLDKPGILREYLLLHCNDPRRPSLSVYISGYIVSKEQLKKLLNKYKNILNENI